MNRLYRQAGLTLVELMTALVIGIVLMAGMAQIFVANKQTYDLGDSVADMQEAARYATYVISRDLRMAGYTGCISRDQKRGANQAQIDRDLGVKVINHLASMTSANAAAFNPDAGVEGWEADDSAYGEFTAMLDDDTANAASSANWSTAESISLNASTNVMENSDVLRVWRVEGDPAFLTQDPTATTLVTGPGGTLSDDDILMVTDCYNADIVKACTVTSSGGATTVSLSGCSSTTNDGNALAAVGGAHVYRLVGMVYYVSKRSAGGNDDATNPPTLYRREIGANGIAGSAQPLLTGVESLQLEFGEDTDTANPDGVANRYVTADNVSDWDNVLSVRIHLLLQSESTQVVPYDSANSTGGQTVAFNGTTVSYTDGRLRYPFVATVSLRNRIP